MKLGWNFIRSLLHDTKDVQHVGIGNIVGKIIVGIFWFYMATVMDPKQYGEIFFYIGIATIGAGIALLATQNSVIVYLDIPEN